MNLSADIVSVAQQLVAVRRDIHAHPEIGFKEVRTSALVARLLRSWGLEPHTGIGRTGVVAVVAGTGPGPMIGLRADMDALPMQECGEVEHRSKQDGVFHGCGHDGHTTMLLGAAYHLSRNRNFPGSIALIFQPAEEGLNGAAAMLADGLFEHYPCDEIYAIHNWPAAPLGRIMTRKGPILAGSNGFDVTVKGRGSHAAQPENGRDPILAASALVQALHTITSRNVSPMRSAMLSVTRFHAGTAYNVIPDVVTLAGTLRTYDKHVRDLCLTRMHEIMKGVGAAYGAQIEMTLRNGYEVTFNDPERAEAGLDIARQVVGDKHVAMLADPIGASEDFAGMLARVPGAYFMIGQGGGASLHNPLYDFDDDLIPIGATFLARLGERRAAALAAQGSP